MDAIKASLLVNGQFRPIVVNRGTHTGREWEVLAGNHTLKAFKSLAEGNPNDTRWQHIDSYVVDLDEEQATRVVLADNRTADLGTYDDKELLGLLDSLEGDLDGTGYNADTMSDLLEAMQGAELTTLPEDEKYTHSITIPHYDPTCAEPPDLVELYSTDKTQQLLADIKQADLPADLKMFLEAAAYRHTVIDFHKVAEYYAHQPAEIQKLMEDSALVIIDSEDAIRNGFLRLGERLHNLFMEDVDRAA